MPFSCSDACYCLASASTEVSSSSTCITGSALRRRKPFVQKSGTQNRDDMLTYEIRLQRALCLFSALIFIIQTRSACRKALCNVSILD